MVRTMFLSFLWMRGYWLILSYGTKSNWLRWRFRNVIKRNVIDWIENRWLLFWETLSWTTARTQNMISLTDMCLKLLHGGHGLNWTVTGGKLVKISKLVKLCENAEIELFRELSWAILALSKAELCQFWFTKIHISIFWRKSLKINIFYIELLISQPATKLKLPIKAYWKAQFLRFYIVWPVLKI